MLIVRMVLFQAKCWEMKSPLIGANVFLEGTTLGSTTDSLGNYVINNIPIGKYIIRADFVGYKTIKKDIYISMKDAEDSEVEISSFSEKLGLEEDTLLVQ